MTVCRGIPEPLLLDRKGCLFPIVPWKWEFALKVWKNCKKTEIMQKSTMGFEPTPLAASRIYTVYPTVFKIAFVLKLFS